MAVIWLNNKYIFLLNKKESIDSVKYRNEKSTKIKNETIIAIITGGASGMGAVEAKIFAEEGAKVLITDIQEEKLKNVANVINPESQFMAGAEIVIDGGFTAL